LRGDGLAEHREDSVYVTDLAPSRYSLP
jgi:hypothetical protein